MNDWLFFGAGNCDLVDILQWRICVRKAVESIDAARLRECCQRHVAWMESEIAKQSALKPTT